MANQQHLNLLRQGVEMWNQWRQEHPEVKPDLSKAQLARTILSGAHLEGADFRGVVFVEKAQLSRAYLEGADLSKTHMVGADLEGATLCGAHLEGANLMKAKLGSAILREANLKEVNLEGAILSEVHLEGATLCGAHLEGADLSKAHLEGADLRLVFFDNATRLDGAVLSDEKQGSILLADVSWGGVNLTVVDWISLKMLGDEHGARQWKMSKGKKTSQQKENEERSRFEMYRSAVRANRQLAVVLREQGLNEEADWFSYRAQKLQRFVFQQRRKFGNYLFSWFLDILAGYGYRPGRSVFWYLFTIVGFALAYHVFGQLSLFPPDAFIYSLTSFHGRGFFPGLEHRISLHDPLVMLAAFEAVIGLFIEISFIATFTQRFFGK
jgi:uncharacterized protein YjbI with pentapeptide repeats